MDEEPLEAEIDFQIRQNQPSKPRKHVSTVSEADGTQKGRLHADDPYDQFANRRSKRGLVLLFARRPVLRRRPYLSDRKPEKPAPITPPIMMELMTRPCRAGSARTCPAGSRWLPKWTRCHNRRANRLDTALYTIHKTRQTTSPLPTTRATLRQRNLTCQNGSILSTAITQRT